MYCKNNQWQFLKNSQRIPKEFPKNSQTIPKQFPKNSQNIPNKNPQPIIIPEFQDGSGPIMFMKVIAAVRKPCVWQKKR